jgi:hypothetical protein
MLDLSLPGLARAGSDVLKVVLGGGRITLIISKALFDTVK